jgi:hypothetical protein
MDGMGVGLAGFNRCVRWLSRGIFMCIFKDLGGSQFSIQT